MALHRTNWSGRVYSSTVVDNPTISANTSSELVGCLTEMMLENQK